MNKEFLTELSASYLAVSEQFVLRLAEKSSGRLEFAHKSHHSHHSHHSHASHSSHHSSHR